MSRQLASSEILSAIEVLQGLEQILLEQERQAASAQQSRGYRRGDPKARAAAAGPIGSVTTFPAHPIIAERWKVVEEEGLAFVGDSSIRVEDGPGPLPALLRDQADSISRDQKDGLNRADLAFSAGFWARVGVEVFSSQSIAENLTFPSRHFIVLRACGLGGFVRFETEEHFQCFLGQTANRGGLIACGFQTLTELEIFCQGSKIAVPAKFEPCSSRSA